MAKTSNEPRALLEGDVLQIGFHGVGKTSYPEDIVPAAVMRAIAQHQKLELGTEGIFWGDYCYFAGVTGEAFRFLEFMGLEAWDPSLPLVERYGHMSAADMYRLAFDAAGLAADIHFRPRLPAKAELERRIIESVRDRRTPVMGVGVFGPHEPFLVTGFDEGGEVLLGWSHLQGEKKGDPNISFEPTGQFRLKDWYEELDGVAIVKGQKRRPQARTIFRGAIERALLELGSTQGDGRALGTAAMEKWAVHLENGSSFSSLSTSDQWKKAHSDHSVTAGDLAERRALAGSFMEIACRVLPEAAGELTGAQTAFQSSHDTVYEIWETVAKTGPFDPDLDKFRDPARRKVVASLVRRLVTLDRRGISFLERALAVLDRRDPGPAIPADPILDGTAVLTKAEPPASGEPIWAPENIHMPNMMGMLRAFLGEPFGEPFGKPFGELNDAERSNRKLDYCMWMGLTGAAFGMLWDGPERTNLPLLFDALGYDYELWMSQKLAADSGLPCRSWGWDDNLRRRILWNLRDRKLPVLLFGCGAWPDWYLVTRVEHGWTFQGYGGSSGEDYRPNEPLDHPRNPLKKIDLFEGMKGKQTWTINVLAKRSGPRPPLEELHRRAVAWGAEHMGRQKMTVIDSKGAELVSSEPYRDWARMMRTDALFPADDAAELKRRRHWLEGYEVELAERRYYGSGFLSLAAKRLGRAELEQAAERFSAVNSLMERVWAALGGMHAAEGHLRLGDAKTREQIAGLLLEMEREDAAAAALLVRAARP